MRKLIVSALAAASLLAAVSAADAGVWIWNGYMWVYECTYGSYWNGFTWVYGCF